MPEVKGLPTEYLFEPWKAPESVQQAAGCLVGNDYPLPLVDHKEQRRVCVQRLKELAHSVGADSPGKYKYNIAVSIILPSYVVELVLLVTPNLKHVKCNVYSSKVIGR